VAFVPTRFPPGGVLNPGDGLISDFDNKVARTAIVEGPAK
jgi:hypothetical protein